MSDDELRDLLSDGGDDDDSSASFLPNRSGRLVSYKGLIERIIEQFNDEFDDAFIQRVESATQKRVMVRDVADYIFGVEGMQLSLKEQATIIQTVYSEVLGYGGLDPFFANAEVTTISIDGVEKLSVRYQPGTELVPQLSVFDDNQHLKRLIERMVKNAGAQLQGDTPIFEVGLTINERRVSVNVAVPPFVTQLRADIRVHPTQLPSLNDLVKRGFLNEKVKEILLALVASNHGFVIVGDTESGKTTLLAVLAQYLRQPQGVISIERTGELRLPEGAKQRIVQWAVGEKEGITFSQHVEQALTEQPNCILLDEVRSDEPHAITALLSQEDTPRQIWSFRGASDAKRIRSSLSMVARMADNSHSEIMVDRLYQRLPFIIIVKRRKGSIQLIEIAEWQYPDGAEYPDYVELVQMGWEALEITGKRPQHALDLDEQFWQKG